jgi:hypothetical protein
MAMGCGERVIKTTNIKASSKKIKKKDMGFILGVVEIYTKVNTDRI